MRLEESIVRAGIRLAILAALVQTIAHLTNEFLLDDKVQGLDPDVEGTGFTWASSVATFAVAWAAALHAAAFQNRRRELAILAAIAVWFSLDDVAIIHERVALKLGEDIFGLPGYAAVRLWLILYLPLLLLVALILWRLVQAAPPPVDRALRLGLGLLVVSIPVEIAGLITRRIDEDGMDVPEDLRIPIEEGLELSGWIVLAAALTAFLWSSVTREGSNRIAR